MTDEDGNETKNYGTMSVGDIRDVGWNYPDIEDEVGFSDWIESTMIRNDCLEGEGDMHVEWEDVSDEDE